MTLRFADAPWLLLLIAVPGIALWLWGMRRTRPAAPVGSIAGIAGARTTWRVRLDPLMPGLRLLGVALLIVALARPQRGEATTEQKGEGIDIVLAFDTSSSMSQPFSRTKTRLEAAQDVLARFVSARRDDRVGLVVFRAASISLSPLTTDYGALSADLAAAASLRLPDGTAIGMALAQSSGMLETSSAATRIVILLTDGENNQHEIEPLAAARIAGTLGIRVYTVGVVSPGRNPARSTLEIDEKALQEIARVTGGTYNRAEDPGALQQIYDTIDRLEKTRFDEQTVMRYDDIAPFVLAAAAAALALEVALRSTYLRRAT